MNDFADTFSAAYDVEQARADRLEVTEAQLVDALAALAAMVRLVDQIGGYLKVEHQRARRVALAILAEQGR